MKIVVFSDLHAHAHVPYSTLLADGTNSRLADTVSCVKQVADLARRVDADIVLFAGDLFHVKRQVPVRTFNATFDAVMSVVDQDIPLVMIHGNHDQADKEGVNHSIHAFRSVATVVDKLGWYRVHGKRSEYTLFAAPYTGNVKLLKSVLARPTSGSNKLFLGHLGVNGARIGADFVYSSADDANITDLLPDMFDAGFLGHFHTHQMLSNNFCYVGATLQHNWGDTGQTRGCVVYDTDTRVMDFVPLKAPAFVVVDAQLFRKNIETCDGCYADCFVRVTDDRMWSTEEKDKFVERCGLRSLEVITPDMQPAAGDTLNVELSGAVADTEQLVHAYVDSGVQDTSGLDPDYLISVGMDVLRESEGK